MNFSYFSRELTDGVLVFEICVALFLLGVIIYGMRHYRFFFWRFSALAFGVFCFEGLTGALWNNAHLGSYAYIHNDISWIMMLMWTSLILLVRFLYDRFHDKKTLVREFAFIVSGASICAGAIVMVLKMIGVFAYSVTMEAYASSAIMISGVLLEAIVYLPVFIGTVYAFYKYWELAMYNKNLFSHYEVSLKKDMWISAIIILSIGYLMHPLLQMTFGSILIIVMAYIVGLIVTSLVIGYVRDIPLFQRYIAAMCMFSIFSIVLISLLVDYGMITLTQSIRDTYTSNTLLIPGLSISDVEFVGIVLFSCLMIAIVRYFKIITDHDVIRLDDKHMTFQGWKSLLMK